MSTNSWPTARAVTGLGLGMTFGWALACGGGSVPTGTTVPDVADARIDGTTLRVGGQSVALDAEYLAFEVEPATLEIWPTQGAVVVRGMNMDDNTPVIVFALRDGVLKEVGRDDLSTHTTFDGPNLVEEVTNCGQTTRTVYTIDTTFRQVDQTVTGDFDEMQCAACPFVDVRIGESWRTAGEILRDLRRPDLEATQSLELPADAVRDGVVTVRIAERKPEASYVDAVWLTVGDVEVAPASCSEGGPLCAIDAAVDVLAFGDVRELVFAVPPGGGPVMLLAHGYYVPRAAEVTAAR